MNSTSPFLLLLLVIAVIVTLAAFAAIEWRENNEDN